MGIRRVAEALGTVTVRLAAGFGGQPLLGRHRPCQITPTTRGNPKRRTGQMASGLAHAWFKQIDGAQSHFRLAWIFMDWRSGPINPDPPA